MAQVLFPGFRAIDANGNTLSGAKLIVYEAGTTTPLDVYTDSALSVAHANPVVADAGGFFETIYAGPDDYKFVLTTAADVDVWDNPIDNFTINDPATATAVTSTTITNDTNVAAGDLDRLFNIDASSSNVTLTADSAALGSGFRFSARLSSSSNSGIIAVGGGQTINGQSNYTIGIQYNSVSLVSNGAGGWDIVSQSNLANIADYTVLGNVSGAPATPTATTILDEDTLVSDSATSLVTQQSVKAYVDTKSTWTFISELALSAESASPGYAITGLSGWDAINIDVMLKPSVDGDISIQLGHSATTWLTGSVYRWIGRGGRLDSGNNVNDTTVGDWTDTKIDLTTITAETTGDTPFISTIKFHNWDSSTYNRMCVFQSTYLASSAEFIGIEGGGELQDVTNSLTAIRFVNSGGGTFTGTILVSGRNFA